MAKVKKTAAVKSPPAKKVMPVKLPANKSQATVRVIVEVVVRNETVSPAVGMLRGGGMELFDAPVDAHPPNFEFTFNTDRITILNFLVGEHEVDLKGDSKFFAPVLDPNPSPKIRVVVFARKNDPDGAGSLELKYKGINIPASPITFTFSNDELEVFNERVKLLKS